MEFTINEYVIDFDSNGESYKEIKESPNKNDDILGSFISKLQFLTNYLTTKKSEKFTIIIIDDVLYENKAYSNLLTNIFPGFYKFFKFPKSSQQYEDNENLEKGYITLPFVQDYAGVSDIFLISDFNTEKEGDYSFQMNLEYSWVNIIRPERAFIKFAPPKRDYSYFRGTVFIKSFASEHNYYNYLLPTKKLSITMWNIEKYIEKCNYVNQVKRLENWKSENEVIEDLTDGNFDDIYMISVIFDMVSRFKNFKEDGKENIETIIEYIKNNKDYKPVKMSEKSLTQKKIDEKKKKVSFEESDEENEKVKVPVKKAPVKKAPVKVVKESEEEKPIVKKAPVKKPVAKKEESDDEKTVSKKEDIEEEKPIVKKAPVKKSIAKKEESDEEKPVVKKAPVKKTIAKKEESEKEESDDEKPVVKKTVVKKAPVKKSPVRKMPVNESDEEKPVVKKAPVKKSTVTKNDSDEEKPVVKKAPVKKSTVKKEESDEEKPIVKKAPVKKSTVTKNDSDEEKPAVKKAPVKKSTVKKEESDEEKPVVKKAPVKRAPIKKTTSIKKIDSDEEKNPKKVQIKKPIVSKTTK